MQGTYVLGPLPGSALTACLVTVGDSACLGVNVDASAIGDVEELRACLADAVEEMVTAGS